MCELLVKAIDANHPDAEIDKAGCYKTGDVVYIADDNHAWSVGEKDTSMFHIVKMPGVPREEMQYLLNDEKEPIHSSAAHKIPSLRKHLQQQERATITRKRYRIDHITQQITDKARP